MSQATVIGFADCWNETSLRIIMFILLISFVTAAGHESQQKKKKKKSRKVLKSQRKRLKISGVYFHVLSLFETFYTVSIFNYQHSEQFSVQFSLYELFLLRPFFILHSLQPVSLPYVFFKMSMNFTQLFPNKQFIICVYIRNYIVCITTNFY